MARHAVNLTRKTTRKPNGRSYTYWVVRWFRSTRSTVADSLRPNGMPGLLHAQLRRVHGRLHRLGRDHGPQSVHPGILTTLPRLASAREPMLRKLTTASRWSGDAESGAFSPLPKGSAVAVPAAPQ